MGGVFFLVETTGLDLHFRPGMGEKKCSHQFLNWWQAVSTGHCHLNCSRPVSYFHQAKSPIRMDGAFCLVETTGLEPVTSCV